MCEHYLPVSSPKRARSLVIIELVRRALGGN
jgi:hypothetical protein